MKQRLAHGVAVASPAAFGRLCVETMIKLKFDYNNSNQPPSGGCVLKLPMLQLRGVPVPQPPSGGCVLKPNKV